MPPKKSKRPSVVLGPSDTLPDIDRNVLCKIRENLSPDSRFHVHCWAMISVGGESSAGQFCPNVAASNSVFCPLHVDSILSNSHTDLMSNLINDMFPLLLKSNEQRDAQVDSVDGIAVEKANEKSSSDDHNCSGETCVRKSSYEALQSSIQLLEEGHALLESRMKDYTLLEQEVHKLRAENAELRGTKADDVVTYPQHYVDQLIDEKQTIELRLNDLIATNAAHERTAAMLEEQVTSMANDKVMLASELHAAQVEMENVQRINSALEQDNVTLREEIERLTALLATTTEEKSALELKSQNSVYRIEQLAIQLENTSALIDTLEKSQKSSDVPVLVSADLPSQQSSSIYNDLETPVASGSFSSKGGFDDLDIADAISVESTEQEAPSVRNGRRDSSVDNESIARISQLESMNESLHVDLVASQQGLQESLLRQSELLAAVSDAKEEISVLRKIIEDSKSRPVEAPSRVISAHHDQAIADATEALRNLTIVQNDVIEGKETVDRNELIVLEHRIDEHLLTISNLTKENENINAQLSATRANFETLQHSLSTQTKKLLDKDEELSIVRAQLNLANSQAETLRTQLSAARTFITELETQLDLDARARRGEEQHSFATISEAISATRAANASKAVAEAALARVRVELADARKRESASEEALIQARMDIFELRGLVSQYESMYVSHVLDWKGRRGYLGEVPVALMYSPQSGSSRIVPGGTVEFLSGEDEDSQSQQQQGVENSKRIPYPLFVDSMGGSVSYDNNNVVFPHPQVFTPGSTVTGSGSVSGTSPSTLAVDLANALRDASPVQHHSPLSGSTGTITVPVTPVQSREASLITTSSPYPISSPSGFSSLGSTVGSSFGSPVRSPAGFGLGGAGLGRMGTTRSPFDHVATVSGRMQTTAASNLRQEEYALARAELDRMADLRAKLEGMSMSSRRRKFALGTPHPSAATSVSDQELKEREISTIGSAPASLLTAPNLGPIGVSALLGSPSLSLRSPLVMKMGETARQLAMQSSTGIGHFQAEAVARSAVDPAAAAAASVSPSSMGTIPSTVVGNINDLNIYPIGTALGINGQVHIQDDRFSKIAVPGALPERTLSPAKPVSLSAIRSVDLLAPKSIEFGDELVKQDDTHPTEPQSKPTVLVNTESVVESTVVNDSVDSTVDVHDVKPVETVVVPEVTSVE